MKQFNGFPSRMEFTPIPNPFFSMLLPQIDDVVELKVTLLMMMILYRKKGYPRFVSYSELAGNKSLAGCLSGATKATDEALRDALKMAVQRGSFIHLALDKDGLSDDVYLLNNAANHQLMAKIQNGELKLSGLREAGGVGSAPEKQPDIFTLYEENIGMLTPMVAEELLEAEKLYPESWLRDAIKEAVNQNKRKWSYISAILQRWTTEGRSDGAYQRNPEASPDKYLRQRYGHMVQR